MLHAEVTVARPGPADAPIANSARIASQDSNDGPGGRVDPHGPGPPALAGGKRGTVTYFVNNPFSRGKCESYVVRRQKKCHGRSRMVISEQELDSSEDNRTMTRILSVENLSKRFLDGDQERVVLDDVSFVVESGSALAVCGPSGCGKSTLLNLIAGILEPDTGRVVLNVGSNEIDYASLSVADKTEVRRKHLGYVFQFFNLVPTLTVRENVLLPLELNGYEHLAGASLDRLAALGLAEVP